MRRPAIRLLVPSLTLVAVGCVGPAPLRTDLTQFEARPLDFDARLSHVAEREPSPDLAAYRDSFLAEVQEGQACVHLKTRVLDLSEEHGKQIFGENLSGMGAIVIDGPTTQELLSELQEQWALEIHGLTFLGQEALFGRTDQWSYISGFEFSANENHLVADPKLKQTTSGLILRALPKATDTSALQIELTLEDTIYYPAITEEVPGIGFYGNVSVQAPILTTQTLSTSAILEPESSLLIGEILPGDGVRLLIVQAESVTYEEEMADLFRKNEEDLMVPFLQTLPVLDFLFRKGPRSP